MIPVNKRQEDNSVIDWKETEKITVEKQIQMLNVVVTYLGAKFN